MCVCVRACARARAFMVSVGTFEGKRPLGRPRHDRNVTLRWISRKCDGEHGLIWLRIGTVARALVNAVMVFFWQRRPVVL